MEYNAVSAAAAKSIPAETAQHLAFSAVTLHARHTGGSISAVAHQGRPDRAKPYLLLHASETPAQVGPCGITYDQFQVQVGVYGHPLLHFLSREGATKRGKSCVFESAG
eukprot:gene14153-biopygen14156